MASPFPATTVLLLRPAPAGLEVFMVQRNRAVGFMPSAWVFPGGRVDPGDRLRGHPQVRGGERAARRMGLEADEGLAYLVAGVRETFEEAGLWLGSGHLPASLRETLAARKIDLAGVLASHEVTVELDRLVPWSWWVTPQVEPKRFDTRFLVAVAPEGEARHDSGETVASAWVSPEKALDEVKTGARPMPPPTWWTLRELSAFRSVEEALAAAEARPQRPIEPRVSATPSGTFELLLPGHPEHPEPAYPGLPTRVWFTAEGWCAAPAG